MSRLLRSTPVTHLVFDMDGLLLDTESIYNATFENILKQFGKTYTDELKTKTMGKRPMDYAKLIVDDNALPLTPTEFLEKVDPMLLAAFPQAKWMPGMPKLLHHLHKNGVPMAVATSSGDENYKSKVTHKTNMFSMFSHVIRGSMVENGKPAPDIFLRAAGDFKPSAVNPSDCLAFEDSPAGVKSARSAGMQCVMIPDFKLTPEDLRKEASLVLSSAHDFQPQDYGLPPYEYRPVTHVIFDMDGLLLDTSTFYSEVTGDLLKEHGKKPDPEFKVKMMGRRHQEIAPRMIEHYDLPITVEELGDIYKERLGKKVSQCTVKEGARELIEHLERHGIRMCVATSSAEGGFGKKTQNHGELFKKFSHVVNGSDPELREGKPAPDIFKIAADRFEDKPDYSRCLVFEDAPNGVEAGVAAGMQVVMVPEGNLVKPELTLKATQMLTTLADFRPEDFNLPPFPKKQQ